jgi:site-specific DNA recombinase
MTTPERRKIFRCAIYTRKSTERNLDLTFNSRDAQREACKASIKSHAHEGWRLVPDRYDASRFSKWAGLRKSSAKCRRTGL